MLGRLPRLRQLDMMSVTSKERTLAESMYAERRAKKKTSSEDVDKPFFKARPHPKDLASASKFYFGNKARAALESSDLSN